MYDPIMRVFLVLEILQGRDSVTGAELAERLEVDLRTVQRYVVRLKDLGIPVASTPGVGGAYRLRSGFRMPPIVLTNEEAFALSLGLRALRQIGLGTFAPATESALAKLGRVLPATVRDSIQTVEDVVSMEPSPWVVPTSIASLSSIAAAIRMGRRIRFGYLSYKSKATQREIEPYAVLHADGRWYLIGYCLSRLELRTFRLDRVTQPEMSATTFERPVGFDARSYLKEKMPFVESNFQIDVWIDMPVDEATGHFALWRVATEEDGAGTRLRCGRDQLETFAAMLLALGKRVRVYSPTELRETFLKLSMRAMEAAEAIHD